MRTRFKKVWCESCKTMQFAGECGHGLVVDPGLFARVFSKLGEGCKPLRALLAPFPFSPFATRDGMHEPPRAPRCGVPGCGCERLD